MSVPTVDEDAWRQLEPGTAHPLQRLRAVRELVDAGINAGVLMAPIVPGFSSSRAKLERTIKAIADHGARFVGCNVMYLQDGTRDHFMRFIEREFPAMRAALREAVREEIPAGRLPEGSAGDGAGAPGALRAAQTRRRRTRNTSREPPRPKPNRSGSPGDRDRGQRDVAERERIASAADAIVAGAGFDRRSRRLTAVTSKCEPSFQCALIGSLICSSMHALQEARAERHAVALRHDQLERLVVDLRSSCRPWRASA